MRFVFLWLVLSGSAFWALESGDQAIRQALAANREGLYQRGLKGLQDAIQKQDAANPKVRYFLAKQLLLMLERDLFESDGAFNARLQGLDSQLAWLKKSLHSGSSVQGLSLKQGFLDLHRRREALEPKTLLLANRRDPQALTKLLFQEQTSQGPCAQGGVRNDAYLCIIKALHRSLSIDSKPFFGGAAKALFRYPYHPRLFATEWNRANHQALLGFEAVHLDTDFAKGMQSALKAPPGSLIVWQNCSGDGRGHIALVTGPSEVCSSFCAPLDRVCPIRNSQGHQEVIGVFHPVAHPQE